MIKYLLALIASALMIVVDQITKYIAETRLKPITSVDLIHGVFSLHYVTNRGASFGIFQGWRWFFIVLTTVVMGGVVGFYIVLPKIVPGVKNLVWHRISLVLIFAGALGNYVDRVRQGYVVDFFYFYLIDFPVFNMADIFIVTGTILLVFLILFKSENNESFENGSIFVDSPERGESGSAEGEADGEDYKEDYKEDIENGVKSDGAEEV